jgi:hypothetical protein
MRLHKIKNKYLGTMFAVFLLATFQLKSGRGDTSAKSESRFQPACEAKLKTPAGSVKPKDVCECVFRNLSKKLKKSDLSQIERLYQGQNPSQLKLDEPTLDFEMEVSAKCLKNSSWRL